MKRFILFILVCISIPMARAQSLRTVPADIFQFNMVGNHVNVSVASGAAAYSLILPTAQGTLNSTLMNDGSGSYSWRVLTASPGAAAITDGSGFLSASPTTATQLGYLSTTTSNVQTQLNTKQATGNYVTGLTGDVLATGPGTIASTVAFVGGQTASAVSSAAVAANAATNSNTASTIVKRDGSGNFSAGIITATVSGSAVSFTGSLAGDVTGNQGSTVVALVGGQMAANVAAGSVIANSATNLNTASTVVKRDGSGNFTAGTITGSLNGNASTSTNSTNFTGSLSGDVTGTQGSTAVAFVGGSSAVSIASGAAVGNAATSTNMPSTAVLRDSSGNFSAGTIAATLSGNATTATTATSFSGALAGDVTGTQGSTAVALVGGQSAANVASGSLLANAATAGAVAATIVKRDASANFSAGTITANLTGNASGSAASFTGPLVGDVTGTQGATVVSLVGGQTASAVSSAAVTVQNATNSNTPSTLVKRDGSGNFSAGTVTAALSGNATSATTAVNVTGTVAIANGGTNAVTSQSAINNISQLTTKGDIEAFDGTNTTRFGIGTNSQVLTASSGAVTGLAWAPAGGVGTITSVSFADSGGIFSNTGSPITSSGTFTENVTGTSGGIPYFNSASQLSSSGLLASNGVVLGGGSATTPSTTAAGSANQVLRVPSAGGAPAFGAIQLASSAAVTGSLTVPNGGTGDTSFTTNAIVVGASTAALAIISNNSTGTNKFLTQSSSAAPAWATIAAGDLPLVSPAASGGTNGAVDGTNGLKGFTDNTAAATGYLGEQTITNMSGSVTTTTADTYVNHATTITPAAGTWRLMWQGQLEMDYNGVSATPVEVQAVVSIRTTASAVLVGQYSAGYLTSTSNTLRVPVNLEWNVVTDGTITYEISVVCSLATASASATINANNVDYFGSNGLGSNKWLVTRIR